MVRFYKNGASHCTDHLLVAKRKAMEELTTLFENKKIKTSHSEERDVIGSLPKDRAEPISYPEKVGSPREF
jgi:hypothetical protein